MNAPQVDARFAPGTVIAGRFRIERVLGHGGMGAVYSALHLSLRQQVAIKVLHGDVAGDAEFSARFKQEAQSVFRLSSPNVVRVLDLGETERGEPFLVMELLKGHDFESVVAGPKAISVANAVDLVSQACVGVATAHAAGIVHRDLKPANLFVAKQADGTDVVKVLDFGIAKVQYGSDTRLTKEGSNFGTPQYMAPEQITSTKDVDARCDQHALGTILYELLAKKPPYQSEHEKKLLLMICTQKPPALREVRPDVPIEVDAAIRCTLAKDPADRFENLGTFVAAIAPFGGQAAAQAVATIERALRPSHIVSSTEAAPARTSAGVHSLSSTPIAGSYSSARVRSGKRSSIVAWVIGAVVVTLAVSATGFFFVLKSRASGSTRVTSDPVATLSSAPTAVALPSLAENKEHPEMTVTPGASLSASSQPSASPVPPPPRAIVQRPAGSPAPGATTPAIAAGAPQRDKPLPAVTASPWDKWKDP